MKTKILALAGLVLFVTLSVSTPGVAYAETCPTLPQNASTAQGSVTLDSSTEYYAWSRVKPTTPTSNSFYLQIDNNCPVLIGGSSTLPNNAWTWINYKNGDTNSKATFQLSSGIHTIKLISNNAPIYIDKITFVKDPGCVPVDFGTNCTTQPTATMTPIPPTQIPPTATTIPSPTNTLVPTASPTKIPSPTPTRIPPSATPTRIPSATPITTKITIYAAGTPSSNVYPTMYLRVKGSNVATYPNVRGNPSTNTYQAFTYTYPGTLTRSDIRVGFSNDQSGSGGDRNLIVDRIMLNNTTYQTEAPSTYSVGSYTKSTGCKGGYKASQVLHCNGYFQY
jgi:hypothetical protein